MWSVGSAGVKMKRAMISVRDDDLSNFKFSAAGGATVSSPGTVRGVFVSMCRTRRVASQWNPPAARVPVGGETF